MWNNYLGLWSGLVLFRQLRTLYCCGFSNPSIRHHPLNLSIQSTTTVNNLFLIHYPCLSRPTLAKPRSDPLNPLVSTSILTPKRHIRTPNSRSELTLIRILFCIPNVLAKQHDDPLFRRVERPSVIHTVRHAVVVRDRVGRECRVRGCSEERG